jgi:hypothetical protein
VGVEVSVEVGVEVGVEDFEKLFVGMDGRFAGGILAVEILSMAFLSA